MLQIKHFVYTPRGAMHILLLVLDLVNPFNAEATFVRMTRMQRFLKKHLNLVMLVFIGCSQMSTHVPGFQIIFLGFFAS